MTKQQQRRKILRLSPERAALWAQKTSPQEEYEDISQRKKIGKTTTD